jgi:hypothetical protein
MESQCCFDFHFHFLYGLRMLNIFSHVYWSFVHILLRTVQFIWLLINRINKKRYAPFNPRAQVIVSIQDTGLILHC